MAHSFQFFRAGGFDQVHFASGTDLVKLGELDPKLWVALACPVKGLVLDQRSLELFDADKDGRIRANELVGAAKWVGSLLKSHDSLLEGKDELVLSNLVDTDEGKRLLTAAKSVLDVVGKASATSVTVADVAEAMKAFDARPFNGDGIVPAASASDDATKQLATEVIDCTGGAKDKSGAQGFTVDHVNAFFAAVKEHAAWLAKADASILVAGAGTAAARDALEAVKAKVNDYFTRCRLAAFDARATGAMNRDEKDFAVMATHELNDGVAEIAALPLAQVQAKRALPLTEINPAWVARMKTFVDAAVTPLLGATTSLTEENWAALQAKFGAFDAWRAAKAGALVEKLGADRVKALSTDGARKSLDALLDKETAQTPIASSLADVEKLARWHRDLHALARNFVNFRDFYTRKKASFQVGTLYLDQRSCELCLRVEDAGKHGTMAPLSRAYLVYCDVVRPASGEKMSIVAAVTAGEPDNLMVGRNGIFVDREGRDWDATVTKLVENPISIRQAFWSPYKKLVRFVEEQVAKRAGDADKAATDSLTAGAGNVAKAGETGKVEEPKKMDVGVVAALGVAVGGITAALGALLQAFFGLGLFMPLGLVGLLLLISGPSMLIAWLKLRQRNIGPLLDASGWAVNANARLNIPFGASLTDVAQLPAGAQLDRRDPFEEERKPWGLYVTLLVVLALGFSWYLGKLDGLLPAPARSVTILGANAPAAATPAAPAKPADKP